MLSWPWEGATSPIILFHAAITMLLTRGSPRVVCREMALGQAKGRMPQAG